MALCACISDELDLRVGKPILLLQLGQCDRLRSVRFTARHASSSARRRRSAAPRWISTCW